MHLEIVCPRCKHLIRALEAHAGRLGQCPYCQTHVPIPALSGEAGDSALSADGAFTPPGSGALAENQAAALSSSSLSSRGLSSAAPADKVQFPCPECGFEVRAPRAAAGKKGQCPKCRAVVSIPAEAKPPESKPPESTSSETELTWAPPPSAPGLASWPGDASLGKFFHDQAAQENADSAGLTPIDDDNEANAEAPPAPTSASAGTPPLSRGPVDLFAEARDAGAAPSANSASRDSASQDSASYTGADDYRLASEGRRASWDKSSRLFSLPKYQAADTPDDGAKGSTAGGGPATTGGGVFSGSAWPTPSQPQTPAQPYSPARPYSGGADLFAGQTQPGSQAYAPQALPAGGAYASPVHGGSSAAALDDPYGKWSMICGVTGVTCFVAGCAGGVLLACVMSPVVGVLVQLPAFAASVVGLLLALKAEAKSRFSALLLNGVAMGLTLLYVLFATFFLMLAMAGSIANEL